MKQGLSKNQSDKTMLNANYSHMNVNYSHVRGNLKRGSYGNPFGIKGPRGMFFNSYPRGFPATGGHFGGFSRGQAMQFYRPSLMKSNSSHSTIVPSMQSNKFDESISICQICHKQGHTADACWHRYDDAHLISFNHFDKSKMSHPLFICNLLKIIMQLLIQAMTLCTIHQKPFNLKLMWQIMKDLLMNGRQWCHTSFD